MAAPPHTPRTAGMPPTARPVAGGHDEPHPIVGTRWQLREHELDSLLVWPPGRELEDGSACNFLRMFTEQDPLHGQAASLYSTTGGTGQHALP